MPTVLFKTTLNAFTLRKIIGSCITSYDHYDTYLQYNPYTKSMELVIKSRIKDLASSVALLNSTCYFKNDNTINICLHNFENVMKWMSNIDITFTIYEYDFNIMTSLLECTNIPERISEIISDYCVIKGEIVYVNATLDKNNFNMPHPCNNSIITIHDLPICYDIQCNSYDFLGVIKLKHNCSTKYNYTYIHLTEHDEQIVKIYYTNSHSILVYSYYKLHTFLQLKTEFFTDTVKVNIINDACVINYKIDTADVTVVIQPHNRVYH